MSALGTLQSPGSYERVAEVHNCSNSWWKHYSRIRSVIQLQTQLFIQVRIHPWIIKSMVFLLNLVIQIIALLDGKVFLFRIVGIERGQNRSIGAAFIDSHPFGFTVMADSLAKEAQCGGGTPFGCQQKINSCSIDHQVQVLPLPLIFISASSMCHWRPTVLYADEMPYPATLLDGWAYGGAWREQRKYHAQPSSSSTLHRRSMGQVQQNRLNNNVDGIMQGLNVFQKKINGFVTSKKTGCYLMRQNPYCSRCLALLSRSMHALF